MPKLTLTNNYGHHCRAKIEMDRIMYDENKEAQETSGNVTAGLEIPPVQFNLGVGGAVARKEEHNKIVHRDLVDPGYTILGKLLFLFFFSSLSLFQVLAGGWSCPIQAKETGCLFLQ
eukprot:TRINITY_DN30143_c0_g1_i2.p1 TRINITY_DN30143_c0_g1~~TRINITY_DN30143_c0_g1_i2.p1  ORF type:complete len:117 (+),score=13.52 TRINITY_DN30143_c0_g1_i2:38-388(+)